ncbi:hypothetical protein WA026_018091 [Henosepilachna vigintioctopunctata]|uniref:Phosphatidylcholine transfer protein n=1 Tax=Henosepilachna vigintioctopunctata TaxID=420089 RepID=A0AAW1UQW3_9CUCU
MYNVPYECINIKWNFKHVGNLVESYLKQYKLTQLFKDKFLVFPRATKRCHSNYLINLWTRQCECVAAQKIQRSYKMFNMYSRLFEEKNVRNLFSRMKFGSRRKGKDLILGSVTLLAFEWEKYRIPEKDMKNHLNDLAYVYTLREKTLCQGCHKKHPTENTENVCHCDNYKSPEPPMKYDNWETFIEKKDLVVWRRLNESGHYEYKVYGSYNDVSAEEFLNVQVDTNYRRIWDTTAIVLEVVDKDPDSNSDIIYWEMLWPMMFSNRDYVFLRRYLVDYNTKTILLANKSTTHPDYPDKSDKFRVKDYWSYMVIKPYTELNKNGIEFVLTYYDNPGVSIPSKVTTWVAMRALPDFLERLRDAAKKYKAYCKQQGVKCICLLKENTFSEEDQSEDYLYYFLDSEEDLITDNTISEAQNNFQKRYRSRKQPKPPQPEVPSNKIRDSSNESEEHGDSIPPATPIVERGTKSLWKYLLPSFYIS